MAKEMMIVFVYDTKAVEDAENDGFDGIVYFHPNWVPEQQRTALCGQVIGTAHCLKSIFSSPRIISLQTGKFFISDFSRYLMVVGTDRNINDWILEYRANLLSSLLKFYHKDFDLMFNMCQNTEGFMTKLYCVLEAYINLLIYGHGGNIFHNIISLQLPKSASCVYLESVQVLRSCQRIETVLGGVLLYHNKIVATQLSTASAKWLVLTNPYHLKSTAEVIKTNFDLPIGTKLLQVYIKNEEYERLKKEGGTLRAAKQYFVNNNFKANPIKEPVLTKIKRDQSLIFTTVPEEGSEEVFNKTIPQKSTSKSVQNRPKFLNLKMKTTDIKQPEIKSLVTTPFQGNTSICSTPLSELNKVLHQNLMSICVNTNKLEKNSKPEEKIDDSLNSLLSAISDNELIQEEEKEDFIGFKKFSSCNDLTTTCDDDENKNLKRLRKTITDPTFPVFSFKGLPISEYLHNDLICNGNLYNNNNIESKNSDLNNSDDVWKSFQDFDSSCFEESKQPIKIVNRNDNIELRKSLTLPLKPETQIANTLRPNSILTPLMSKLSILEMEEKEKSENIQKANQKSTLKRSFSFFNNNTTDIIENDDDLKPVTLFICGQQDMVVCLFLDQDSPISLNLINQMYETCTDSLGKLDKQIRQCLEAHPGGSQIDANDPYSYLCLKRGWDTVQKIGAWDSYELSTVSNIHRDFLGKRNLTEVTIRGDIYIVYGNNSGSTEIYYNQATSANAGLPTPADQMSIVSLKAKRRLERDHAIVLH
nr:uncharacterized protein LOC111413404 [Onthophagus taurus]